MGGLTVAPLRTALAAGPRPRWEAVVWLMRGWLAATQRSHLLVPQPVRSDRSFELRSAVAEVCARPICRGMQPMMHCELLQAEQILGQMQPALPQRSQVPQPALGVVAHDSSIAIMETYPILSEDKARSSAFQVENAYIAVSTIVQLLQQVEDVTEVQPRKKLSGSSELHVEFKYLGQPYIVWEPFGDNSRYWIGPKDGVEAGGDSTAIEQVFKRYRPPLYRTIIGNVITLRFITRWATKNR